jgi:hypothetical protein
MIDEPYPGAGVFLRCPNEPEDKEGLLTLPERHEAFSQPLRATMTMRFINNGRHMAFDRPERSARDQEVLGSIVCETCGAEAIIKKGV